MLNQCLPFSIIVRLQLNFSTNFSTTPISVSSSCLPYNIFVGTFHWMIGCCFTYCRYSHERVCPNEVGIISSCLSCSSDTFAQSIIFEISCCISRIGDTKIHSLKFSFSKLNILNHAPMLFAYNEI